MELEKLNITIQSETKWWQRDNDKVQREHHRTSPEIYKQLILLLFNYKKWEGKICRVQNKVAEMARKFRHEK